MDILRRSPPQTPPHPLEKHMLLSVAEHPTASPSHEKLTALPTFLASRLAAHPAETRCILARAWVRARFAVQPRTLDGLSSPRPRLVIIAHI